MSGARIVRVELGPRSYDVVIGAGLLGRPQDLLAPVLQSRRVAVVTDENVGRLHGAALSDALRRIGITAQTITIAPGEGSKNFETLSDVLDQLLALELGRGDVLVALGGGVIGDLGGFAAAIYKRGIDFIQIPTTLLALVDSSVGGKAAIDTPRGKNLIGAFHQPRLVLADVDFLSTLDERQMRAGYGEVLKYGLLGNADFFEWLEINGADILAREPSALIEAVEQCVGMKAAIVKADEQEQGRRALLNLGHTFGHALEVRSGFSLLHGEAVGLGCAMAFRFSKAQGLCTKSEVERVERAIAKVGLPVRLDQVAGSPFSAEGLLSLMAQDKKAEGGRIALVLVRGIGQAFIAKDIDRQMLFGFLVGECASG